MIKTKADQERAVIPDGDSPVVEAYRVVQIAGTDGQPAPPEIAERFQGRAWTKRQLEERGVRITGAAAWFLASGRDWRLRLEPIS